METWITVIAQGTALANRRGTISCKEYNNLLDSLDKPIDEDRMNKDTFRRLYNGWARRKLNE
jgi:hypothetical protein